MRDNRNGRDERPSLRLVRGPDGRLRSAGDDPEITDVWAEQQRIRLAEAIAQDKQQAEKRQKQGTLLSRWRPKLRRRSTTPKAATPLKEVELQISLPKLKLPFKKIAKKRVVIGGMGLVVVAALIVSGVMAYQHQKTGTVAKKNQQTTTRTLGERSEKPSYTTLLPDGKDIDQLGGWQRVSPPDQEAVFAYVDKLSGIQINVSEQPLPESFKTDVAGKVADLAKQFNAKETIEVDGITVYIGTSAKGPQSVVLVKNDLLILIKSTSKIDNDQWAGYIASLK